ncbi:AAA family ATPase [Crassaminicella thermophila]|uniref:AAA family ATPase n=1 Tax=Crassaminicella thermophila TaxID=2599308 RepID=A0A5C0SBY5_CRATE|nr:TRC40/GET3/ArsA family transport-energizing ATPase [Crassaminicella thermophila]QEK11620.1 AAA family ATPase [Crassaminicella thermophila]
MNKFVFFGGKGGVGKTTSSAAYGYNCAKKGMKTLVVSTDPAHSLCDIFETTIGSEIKKLKENLYALEIDPEKESIKYINRIKTNMKKTVSPVIISEIEKQLDAASVSPGSEESAIFDKLVEIINEYGNEFDKVVFDTAPTGHTLRLLSLPELLGGWLDRLIEKRQKALKLLEMSNRKDKDEIMKDPVIEILSNRKKKLEKAREILIDRNMISFVFVLNAERLPIEETKKAVNVLEKYKIPVNDLVVNKILPDSISDDFWRARKELEDKYLQEILKTFKDKEIIKIPLLNSDVRANHIEVISQFF